MRLLDTRTGEFHWINDPEETRYATLSHVWSKDGEQSFQDLQRIQAEVRAEREYDPFLPDDAVLERASPKIRDACAYARADGLDYIWIDSCCIDKTSSAELSEAINSMYAWYGQSIVCYAYLHDVPDEGPRRAVMSQLRRSAWFTRGWTLQELIAPREVVFVSREWRTLGDKVRLSRMVGDVTGIDGAVLCHSRPLSSVSVARRMSWASKRVTTRKEDEAYSLMGIFGVNMPTIYGEGRLAFVRLQEEILKQIPDQSLFAWNLRLPFPLRPSSDRTFGRGSLFAVSPAWFMHSEDIRSLPREQFSERLKIVVSPSTHLMASYGLRTFLPVIPVTSRFHLAILACEDRQGRLLAYMLTGDRDAVLDPVGVTSIELDTLADLAKWYRPRLRPYALQRWNCMRLSHYDRRVYLTACGNLRMAELYISRGPQLKTREVAPPLVLHAPDYSVSTPMLPTLHAPSPAWSRLEASDLFISPFYQIQLASRCTMQLTRQQYYIDIISGGDDLSVTHTFVLSKLRSSITIEVGPCSCVAGDRRPGRRISRLALSLTVTVAFPSYTATSDLSPVMFTGCAFDRDATRIAVEHDWDHPAHRTDAQPAMRRARMHNTFSSQEFSFLDSGDGVGRPFLQLVLDQDCPGDTHYPARFTLAIDLNAPPRAPAFPPTRWFLPGPVPRRVAEAVVAKGKGKGKGKGAQTADVVRATTGAGGASRLGDGTRVPSTRVDSVNVAGALVVDGEVALWERLWDARDKLADGPR